MFKLLAKYTKDGWWAAVLGPVFVIFEVIFDAIIPYVMSLIIDVGITERGGDLNYILKMGGIMVLLALGAGLCGLISGLFSTISSARFVRNIRDAMYRKIQTYDFKNIEKFPVPTVVMRLTTDMRMMRLAYISIVRLLIRAPINLIISAYMVFKINSGLAGIFAIAIPLLGFGLIFMIIKAHPRFVTLMSKFDMLNDNLKENIEAIRVVKTFVREEYENKKFSITSWIVTTAHRFAESILILSQPFFEIIMYGVMIAVAWLGGNLIITGSMSTGQFMSFLSYVKVILFSLILLSNGLLQIVAAQASVVRANQILDEEPDINNDDAIPDLKLDDGSVEFKNVTFKYFRHSKNHVLSDINLKINSGEVIGILGTTGSSKTSLVSLIPRLYDIDSGELNVGGHPIKEYDLFNLRNEVSMVLQKNTLFSGTIEENLKWGDENASHEEVVKACKIAQADDFINKLPDGYNTDLGQGGVNVSGGQKQRLCIARALLKKPKILILDDSTSAVDTDTDHRIQVALKENLGDMTTIIIAQRVTSVKEANRIIIMNEGKIEDIGNHDELMARNEVYRDLYQTQMEGMA